MTSKERFNVINALAAINSAISEIKYYMKSNWLSDETALNYLNSAKEYLDKARKK